MKVINYTEARGNFKKILDDVAEDFDPTIISRRDHQDAVIMSLNHYNSLIETLYLLSNKNNAQHLASSIEQHQAVKTQAHDLLEND